MKKIAAWVMVSILFSGILAACESGTEAVSTPNSFNDPQWQEAAGIYKQQCISCHAADMSGRVGPNLQQIGSKLDREKIAATIGNGRGGMPAFKKILNPDEINMLAEWLASKK